MLLLPTDIHNSKMMKIISLCAKKESPTYTSLFRISIYLNFMPNFSVKIVVGSCGGGRAVHLKYTVFICLLEYDGTFWVIKVSDLSVFLNVWLNFSFWILWHEISQKSRACMENITLLPSKFAQIIIYVNMLRYETVVIKWKYVHCELGAEIFHFNLVFCCREKRKSPLNMVEKSYKNWPLWFFLFSYIFWR